MGILSNVLILCLVGAVAAADLPESISTCLTKAGSSYALSRRIDPHALPGDFDGDMKPDVAVLVARGGAQGIVVCRSGGSTPVVLGAGTRFNDMKDLDFSVWRLHPVGRRVSRGVGEGRRLVLTGDALYLEWESASAIVYWNGRRFSWYQQGD